MVSKNSATAMISTNVTMTAVHLKPTNNKLSIISANDLCDNDCTVYSVTTR